MAGNVAAGGYRLDPFPASALAAALDVPLEADEGAPLPPFWHGLYGHVPIGADATGPDGHPLRGGFLPAAPGRRMWAGGEFLIEGALRFGDEIERRSEVVKTEAKRGRVFPLLFVEVEHVHTGPAGRIVERQHLVYVDGPPADQPPGGPLPRWPWRRAWRPDPVLLFRYSALTWNGHRIHYDADYARGVEGYRGLVVHGPLIATLLLRLVAASRPTDRVRRFSFRALAPLFVDETLTCLGRANGNTVELAAHGGDGRIAMRAEAVLEA